MDYTKEELIEYAINRLEALDDVLNEIQSYAISACAERRVVRNLLYLACENKNPESKEMLSETIS